MTKAVAVSTLSEFQDWLSLAREVEPLFGPMADDPAFQQGLKQAISDETAFCTHQDRSVKGKTKVTGGVIISNETGEILWLAVSQESRGHGLGQQLIAYALEMLNEHQTIIVQTFAPSHPEGQAARKLYLNNGFVDDQDGGLNPAGLPTVIMKRSAID